MLMFGEAKGLALGFFVQSIQERFSIKTEGEMGFCPNHCRRDGCLANSTVESHVVARCLRRKGEGEVGEFLKRDILERGLGPPQVLI